ncbi:MAG: M20/M25/M40 family metallo-hydrolase [Clostridia bacterium]
MRYENAIDMFLKLVSIESESLHESEIVEFIEQYAKENWDCKIRRDEIHFADLEEDVKKRLSQEDKDASTEQIYIEIPSNDDTKASIMLGAHVDTVAPCKDIKVIFTEDGKIKTDGTTILGGDDKSGVAGIMCAIDQITKDKRPHGKIVCVFTACEEKGLLGARLTPVNQFGVDYGFVFDTTGSVGSIVERVQYSQNVEINIEVKDIPTHAMCLTVENALGIAGDIIGKLPKGLWDKAEYTMSNIVSLKTENEVGQMVPNKAIIKYSIRSFIETELKVMRDMYTKIISGIKYENAEITFTVTPEKTMGYDNTQSETGRKMMGHADEALREMGITPYYLRDGLGGHDASVYRRNGVPSVVLSSGMQDIHSTKEWIYKDDLLKTTELILKLIDKA